MCAAIVSRGLVVAYVPRRSISSTRKWARNVGEESFCGTGICLNQVISEGSTLLASICSISKCALSLVNTDNQVFNGSRFRAI